MSIKPLGGIFGRNPTFNDVTVEGELTVEGATTYGSNVTINGNLTVNGTETILDVVTLEVEDPNIILGKNNTTDPQADGGGITLKGATNKTIVWSDTNDHWTISDALEVDNLRLDGNTLSSTDASGNVVIAPNGTGDVQLDADTVRIGDSNANATLTTNGTGNLILNTNAGTNSGSITIANGTNGNITVAPNGAGDVYLDADTVRIGDSNTNATLTTNGTGDLILNTNSGTNSGSITIQDAANGNILIATNGTGQIQFTGDLDATTLEVTNIKAKDGTAAIALTDSTGAVGISTAATLSAAVTMSATTQNIALGTSQTSGTWTAGGAAQTGTLTLDQSTKAHTLNIGTGATENATVKTINIGTGGVSGSTTNIAIGSTNGTTVTLNGTVNATTVNGTTFDTNVAAAGVTLSGVTLSADGTDTNIDINITPKGNGEVNITKVDIDAGSMDGVVIGASSRQEATFTRVYAQDPSDSTYYMVLAPQSLSPFGNGSLINYKGSLVLGTMTGNTNPVLLYSNGVEGLRVNGGNTGFGVVDPTSYRLQLAGSGDKIGVDISSGGTTRTSFIEFYASANGGMTLSTTNSSTGGIKLQTQGADVIEARRDGNVNITNKLGVGSTAPTLQLSLGSPTAGRGISWDTNGAGNYCNIWAGYSNGDLVLATQMKGTTATADGFLSSFGDSVPRTAIRLNAFDSDGIQFYASQASTVAVDSAVTPTVQFQVMNDGTGDVKVHNGNVVIGTSGKGIDFSATAGAGGSTGELLDDYEEGTWTPTYSPASGSFTSITYGFSTGWYRKIGSMVVCTVSMRTSALTVGTASGDVYLDSLPFAALNNTSRPSYAPIAIATGFVTTNPSGVRVQMDGSTKALIQTGFDNSALQVSNLSTGGANNFLAVTFAYITND